MIWRKSNELLVSHTTGGFEAVVRHEGVAVSGGTISFVALCLGFNF
jgi:hypothetical protein